MLLARLSDSGFSSERKANSILNSKYTLEKLTIMCDCVLVVRVRYRPMTLSDQGRDELRNNFPYQKFLKLKPRNGCMWQDEINEKVF